MSVGEFVTSFFKKTKESSPSMACLGLPVRMLHGPFQFQVRLLKGTAYDVQVSTDLVTWVGIAKETAPENTFDYVDSDASKFGFRCYRVIANGVVSDVVLGFATVTLPPGFSMIANPLNGPNNSVAGLFPKMSDGDVIHLFNKDSQKYLVFPYDLESWEKNSPIIAIGESFWVGKTSPDNWVRNFSMGQV